MHNNLTGLSNKFCYAILFLSFGIFHRDTKISAGDTKKELKEAVDSNPNWRQLAGHLTDQDSAPMETERIGHS